MSARDPHEGQGGGAPAGAAASSRPRVRRLKKRREFLAVADARNKWSAAGLILQAAERQGPSRQGAEGTAAPEGGADPDIGLGFTVSKKVGNAVTRNRARRRLRAAAALVVPERGRPGMDYVLIGRRETVDRPFADLVRDLATSLDKVARPRRFGPRPAEAASDGAPRRGRGR